MEIDETTKVPIFAAIVTLPAIVCTCFWIGALSSRVDADEARLERIALAMKEDRAAIKVFMEKQIEIAADSRDRLIVVETILKIRR
jgi:hypothetical protein